MLSYEGVHAEGWFWVSSISVQGNLQLMYISNIQRDIPLTANNVRARIDYTHADGEKFTIREAIWLENVGTAEFPNRVHIRSAKTGRLCVAIEQREGPFIVIEGTTTRSGIKSLRPGKWRLQITLSMDNGPLHYATGGFHISEDNRIDYEKPNAFILWRDADFDKHG